MDMTSNRSPDEDRVMQRQLYRAGQTQPAPKTPASAPARSVAKKGSSSSATGAAARSVAKAGDGQKILHMILLLGVGYYLLYGNPSQRRKALVGLGVAAWLLLLGGISYCLCLPDLADMNRQRRAIFEDKNLTMEEKFEKIREMDSKLTPAQRRQMRELARKEMIRKNNVRTVDFLKLSPEEQVAQLKKEAAEWEKRRAEWKNKAKGRGPGNRGGPGGGKGNASNGNKGNGGGGRPGGGWGGGGGGGGGGGMNRDVAGLENGSSPESRAGGAYKNGLRGQLGLNKGFGGRGGPGGGR